MRPTITLCMIVRNEERFLADCLASVRGVVDDMVIVDTGSTDATKRLAREAGARVFDFTWCDDFAAARNDSLKHARGAWVLVLDADERLARGSARKLRAAVKGAAFDCGMVRLHEARRVDSRLEDVISGKERDAEIQLVPRLLRRAPGLEFVDAIHENVGPWLRRRGMKVAGVDLNIVHLGATEQVRDARSKAERNVRLLRARLERRPDDVSASGYLALEYMRAGALAQAQDVTDRAWPHVRAAGEQGICIHRLAVARAHLLVGAHRFGEARESVELAREFEGDSPDLAFFSAYAAECEVAGATDDDARCRLLSTACDGYRQCLAFGDQLFAQAFVAGSRSWYGWLRLGTVELLRGHAADARHAFDEALAARPDYRDALLGRAEATWLLGDLPGALAQLEPLLDDSPDGWTLAACTVEALGQPSDARLFASRARVLAGKGFVSPHRRAMLGACLARIGGAPAGAADSPRVTVDHPGSASSESASPQPLTEPAQKPASRAPPPPSLAPA